MRRSVAATAFLTLTAGAVPAQDLLPGKFEVGMSGTAAYHIPIGAPPGSAGVRPTLSLNYNSRSGNGIVGIGWSLAGLPSIGRCSRTLAQDGVRGGVNYDANDRFCLDGQRLVAINGAYGADGTEYRTEVESFSKIISHGTAGTGPAWFEVRTKSGQVMEFGHTADSQILAQGKLTVRNWPVNKVSDTAGNYFTVTYINDAPNGQAYPSRIDYTGNAASGLSPYNSVRFVYATRPDIAPQYQAGSMIKTTVRLTNVQTYLGNKLALDYRLAYDQSFSLVPRSRLSSITLCASDSTCLPATTVAWTTGNAGGLLANTNNFSIGAFGSPPVPNWMPIVGDFNGDGRTDFLFIANTNIFYYLSNGDGTFTAGSSAFPNGWSFGVVAGEYAPIVGDHDGDGKTDFALLATDRIYTFLSNGDGSFRGAVYDIPNNWAFGTPPGSWYLPIAGDFNGDGRTDIVVVGGRSIFSLYSKGDGSYSAAFSLVPNNWDLGSPRAFYAPIVGDFNGDGKTDFALLDSTQVATLLSNGDGTFAGSLYDIPNGWAFGSPPTSDWMPIVGDFNGDGKTDFVIIGFQDVFSFFSKGDGTFVAALNQTPANVGSFGGAITKTYTPIVGDFNGDGKTDYALTRNDHFYMLLSNGDGTFAANIYIAPGGLSFFSPPTSAFAPIVGDFDGDGRTDFALVWNSQAFVFRADGQPFSQVTRIAAGDGVNTSVTYQPLTKGGSLYTKDNDAVFPVLDLQPPFQVVSRVDTQDGIGGNYTSTYSYAGLKADLSGRGLLGFRQVTGTDLQTNIVATTRYRQDFPYIGLVVASSMATVATPTRGPVLLNQATNSYGATALGSTRSQVFLTQSVAQSVDLDGTSLPTIMTTYQYDAFGNPTQVVVSTPDGYSKTTSNTYDNDTVKWLLGRLRRASVTSVVPAAPPPPPPPPGPAPDMTIALAHSSNFVPGQIGATYTVTASNVGNASTSGAVTVTETAPTDLTVTSMSGIGWSCTGATCTRADALAAGASYPPITASVNVALNAPSAIANVVTVSGGGESNTGNNTASDPTNVLAIDVTISTASNNFNLWNYLNAIGKANGGHPSSWTIHVTGGLNFGSASTSAYAFDTGSFPVGSTVWIFNNAGIVGAGGAGGTGGACNRANDPPPIRALPGQPGGPAFRAQVPVTMVNNGVIWGGGGGGGGGNAFNDGAASNPTFYVGGGGGGGAGLPAGAGGAGGFAFSGAIPAKGGASGSFTAGGRRGDFGGDGGGPGQAGFTPDPFGAAFACTNVGAGGAAGFAVTGNSLVTWTTIGDVRGQVAN